MKRFILGAEKGMVGTVLHQDDAHPLERDQPPREVHLVWASNQLAQVVDDVAAGLESLEFDLEPGQTRFIRIHFAPHDSGMMHRTPHTVDYLTVLAGSITVEMGDSSSVLLRAGDMGVQICGFHRWRNDSDESCILGILVLGIEADPPDAPGREVRP
jgi:quercetin dioxygenase-like cupin family protein